MASRLSRFLFAVLGIGVLFQVGGGASTPSASSATPVAAASGFTITSPAAGVIVPCGQPVTVTWTGGSPSDNVNLLLIDAQANQVFEGFGIAPNTGSRVVTIGPGSCGRASLFYVEDSPRTTWSYGPVFTVGPAPTTLTVNDLGDTNNGACTAALCTLRDAITVLNANGDSGASTINFAVTGTITLSSALPAITKSVILNGPGAGQLTITRSDPFGSTKFRIFDVNVASPSAVTISGVTLKFGNASTSTNGGAIQNRGTGTLNVNNSVLRDNAANVGGGGAIYNAGSATLNVDNSVFAGNGANTGSGGAIQNLGIANISNTTIAGNGSNSSLTALGLTLDGGGITNSGTLTISNSTLSNNRAYYDGGAIANGVNGSTLTNKGTVTVINSTFSGNNGGAFGGVIQNYVGTTSTFVSSTLSGNTASTGGAIHSDSTVKVQSTIVAQNTASTAPDVSGSITSLGHNVIGNTSGASVTATTGDQLNPPAAQLHLGSLATNGGPTQTIALLAGSIAIDAGDDAVQSAPYNVSTDQRGSGYPRKTGAHVDVGAYETTALIATSLTIATPVNPAYGGTATLSATLSAGATPVANEQISFTLNGSPAGAATTNASGVATITGVSIAGLVTGQTYGTGASFAGDSTYAASSVNGTLIVAQAAPTVTWSAPAPIVYGTALSGTQLNATASVDGTFAYSPAGGAILPVGSNPLSVTFTPADSVNYSSVTTSVVLQVLPNRAPTVQLLGAYTPDHFVNGPFTLDESLISTPLTLKAVASDPDGDTLSYSWQLLPGSSGNLFASGPAQELRTYTNGDGPSSATLRVTVTDGHGGSASADATITVNNIAPSVHAGVPGVATVGLTFSTCISFFDPGPDSPWTATVDYGDGTGAQSVPASSISAPGPCGFGTNTPSFNLSHVYAQATAPGTRSVVVTVTDKDGGVGMGSFFVTVNKAMPALTINSAPVNYGTHYTFTVTVASHNGGPAPTGSVIYSIGGGATSAPQPLAPSGPSQSSVFIDAGVLPVGTPTRIVTYSGDGNYFSAGDSRTITINKATPTVSVSSSVNPSNYTQTVTYTATVTGAQGASAPAGSVLFTIDGVGFAQPTLAGGMASFSLNSVLQIGNHTVTATYNGDGSYFVASSLMTQTINQTSPPAFSRIVSAPAGACICTPLLMNASAVGSQHWFAKADTSGSMSVTAVAHSVNSTDPETVQMSVFDSNGQSVGTTVSASYPAGTAPDTEASASTTFNTTPGAIYRIAVSTPNTPPTQPHYRLKILGAGQAGMPSPAYSALEMSDDETVQWVMNANAGETLRFTIFPPAFYLSSSAATTATAQVVDLSAPGVLVPLVDPSNPSGPSVTSVTINPGTGNSSISVAAPASSATTYAVVLSNVNGHYRLSKVSGGPSGDSGIYATWQTTGRGTLNAVVSVAGNAPFNGTITAAITIDGYSIGTDAVPVGTTTDDAPVGHYHLDFTAPPGYRVTPASIDFDVTCGAQTNVRVVLDAPTTTTVSAPAITFGANGVVTVTVGALAGAPTGSVSLSVDGGAAITQPVSGGSTTFAIQTPSAGDHQLIAAYGAQGLFGASAGTGTLHVDKASSTTTLVSSVNPAAQNTAATFTATITSPAPRTGSVTFTDGTTTVATVNLNGTTQASVTIATLALGSHTIVATYSGDANITGSASAPLTQWIYALTPGTTPNGGVSTTGGAFVIGDNDPTTNSPLAVGAKVTFWSSQWSALNALSGGTASAVDSFKGFANVTGTPPAPTPAGAATPNTWNSDPGNSAGPPSTVASYIGVIVSSTATKSGSVLAGDIPRMVVVKTDSGYDGNPGHVGTGRIVAVIK